MLIVKSFYSRSEQLEIAQSIVDEQASVYFDLLEQAKQYGLVTTSNEAIAILEYAKEQDAAWYSIANTAQEFGLISSAYGGTMVLAHPDEQIKKGHYHRIQVASGNEGRCKETVTQYKQMSFGGLDNE